VAELFSGGSGFLRGDIVTRVNGGPAITTYPDLLSQLRGLKDAATFSVEREGKSVDVLAPLRVVADPLKVRNINLSGLIISEPWRLDNIEVNPSHYLVVDWYESGEEAASTDALISDFIVSVDGREFSSVDTLYRYLDGLPSDANVSLILKRASSASEFHREFRHITLSRRKLEWIAVH
jgi:S1-C subfamily serine protease